jgi:hypothetical protein
MTTRLAQDVQENDISNIDPLAYNPDRKCSSWFPVIAMIAVSALVAEVLFISYGLVFSINFLGLLLILFALVKLFDIDTFVHRFSQYDLISSRVKIYGFLFPVIELVLGLAYLGGYNPRITSYALFGVGVISTLGLLVNFKHRDRLYTASLGSIGKMPLTTMTLLENVLMIGMGLFYIINRT